MTRNTIPAALAASLKSSIVWALSTTIWIPELFFARATTREIFSDVTTGDVDALRTEGFTDRDIHDICEVAAYYAYVNRIADGLGVQLETWLPDD